MDNQSEMALTFTIKPPHDPHYTSLFVHVKQILEAHTRGLTRMIITLEYTKKLVVHAHVYLRCESLEFIDMKRDYLYNNFIYFKPVKDSVAYIQYIKKCSNDYMPSMDECYNEYNCNDSIIQSMIDITNMV